MAAPTKTEDGKAFPRSDYAYTPDPEAPSTWKLRLTRTPGGDPDPGIVGAAAAALGPGFRGQKVQIPAADRPKVKAKVRAAWKKANPDKDPDEMPDALKAAEPSRITFLNRLYAALKERWSEGGFLSSDDFATVFKSARGHAGGKARAELRAQLLAAEGGDMTGCIVCLVPDPDTAQALAVDGGLTPEQLHLTLCHFGDLEILGPIQKAEALLAVRDAAAVMPVLSGEISGIGRFTNGEQDVIYASLDAPELNRVQDFIATNLESHGFEIADDHGFTPHFSLTYVDSGMPNPIENIEARPVQFDAVSVWFGPEHITVPLLGINAADGDGELMDDATGTPYEYLASEPSPQEHAQSGDLADLAAQGHTHRLFNSIAFAEAPAWIPYLPKPGSYAHPKYGTITITRPRNARFVGNFQSHVYQDRLPIDAEHETKLSGAVGWIVDMRLNEDGSADAQVEWTDRGKSFFAADRFRYFSPEWYDRWEDPATRDRYQDVAIGGALTTRPFFKDPALRPLFASEGSLRIDETDTDPQLQGVDMDAQQFAELETKVKELETKLAARENENATLKSASETAAEQAKQTAERLAAVETERRQERFTALIKNEGARWFGETDELVTELERFAKTFGEDSAEFASYVKRQRATAAILRTSAAFNEQGSDGGGRTEEPTAKLDRMASERAAKESISYQDALAKVANENPTLYAQHSSAAYVRTKGAE